MALTWLPRGGVLYAERTLLSTPGNTSYFARFYWFLQARNGIPGTIYLSSTGESARVHVQSHQYFDVFWRPGSPDVYLGIFDAEFLGKVGDVYPRAHQYPSMVAMLTAAHIVFYDGVCGFSLRNQSSILDEGRPLCALDLYLRGPISRQVFANTYTWYALFDAREPAQWYMGTQLQYLGVRVLDFPDTVDHGYMLSRL